MTDKDVRQLVVVGAGPGGYAAAFHAADLGLKVTLIDSAENPGGVCLHRGCIPTKALLHAAKVITEAREAGQMGIEFSPPKIDMEKVQSWKNSVISKLTGGLGMLCKKKKLEYLQGRAIFTGSNTLDCQMDGTIQSISFEHAIAATGARPVKIPVVPDAPGILDSTSALEMDEIPKSMLVIGGGYIGLELGSAFANFGTKVTVVEMMPQLMTGTDPELVRVLARSLQGIFGSVLLNTKVVNVQPQDGGFKATFEDKNQEQHEEIFEKVLVAVGRKPNSEGLGLENTKVQVDERGFVKVNQQLQTDDPSIYAIGDLVGAPQLAHKATHEGLTAAKVLAEIPAAFEPKAIPFVEYTEPEIAQCGLSEKQARVANLNIKVSKFPWQASGRALTLGQNKGLTKLIMDADTERILGAGIVGSGAGELIAEMALAIEMAATASDIAMTIHPHPTLSETIMEAAEGLMGHSIHV